MRALLAVVVLCALSSLVAAKCDGACQDNSNPCPGTYQAGLCPGPDNIQCCPEPTPDCPGQCQDNSLPCGGTYASGMCPGPDNVQCCKSGGGGACQSFADSQWDCADPECSSRVPSGSGQPGYQCAEFVSRTLASAGHIQLDPLASQSTYEYYNYQGNQYDLLWVSSKQGGPLGLEDFLIQIGWQNVGADPSSIVDCSAVMTNGAHGAYSHTVVGIGAGVVDAHNNARYHADGGFYNINAIYNPPGARGTNSTATKRPISEYRRSTGPRHYTDAKPSN